MKHIRKPFAVLRCHGMTVRIGCHAVEVVTWSRYEYLQVWKARLRKQKPSDKAVIFAALWKCRGCGTEIGWADTGSEIKVKFGGIDTVPADNCAAKLRTTGRGKFAVSPDQRWRLWAVCEAHRLREIALGKPRARYKAGQGAREWKRKVEDWDDMKAFAVSLLEKGCAGLATEVMGWAKTGEEPMLSLKFRVRHEVQEDGRRRTPFVDVWWFGHWAQLCQSGLFKRSTAKKAPAWTKGNSEVRWQNFSPAMKKVVLAALQKIY